MTPRQARELRAALERMNPRDAPRNSRERAIEAAMDAIEILAREALEAAEVWDQQIGDRG